MDIKTIKIKLIAIFSAILFCTYGEKSRFVTLVYKDDKVTIYHINIDSELINMADSLRQVSNFDYWLKNYKKYKNVK